MAPYKKPIARGFSVPGYRLLFIFEVIGGC
jgi:hypothetical protein